MRHDPGKGWTNYCTVSVESRSVSLSLVHEYLSNSSVSKNLQEPLFFLSEVPQDLERRHLGLTTQEPQLLSNTSGLVLSDLWFFALQHPAVQSLQQRSALGCKRDGQTRPQDCGGVILSKCFSQVREDPNLQPPFFKFFSAYQVVYCKISPLRVELRFAQQRSLIPFLDLFR